MKQFMSELLNHIDSTAPELIANYESNECTKETEQDLARIAYHIWKFIQLDQHEGQFDEIEGIFTVGSAWDFDDLEDEWAQ